ncbi:hypothetical protein [Caenimonas koreensis]
MSPIPYKSRVNPKYPIINVAPQQKSQVTPMYIVLIGWIYVALMMSVAEATNTTGTVLGAVFTFLLYGVAPVSLVLYLMGTPARKRAIKAREAAELAAYRQTQAQAVDASGEPDGAGETAADAVAPVREKP